MLETLFIADLHLDPKQPIIIERCLNFLSKQAKQAECLYILGDLFEVWLGDDDDEPAYQPILTALKELTNNVPVFIIHGNRDFLIAQDFLRITGCQLITEPYIINLHNVPTLLMHGDTLCTLDLEYQAFRRQVRNPQWQQYFLQQPLSERRKLATQARMQSKIKTKNTDESIMDVSQDAVISILKQYQVRQLIHGHTHRPNIHKITVDNKIAHRIVVGDWQDNQAIIFSSNGNQLIKLY
ncbi:MAG: UDP-2,3-diacylglucosamine diphosphatase [Thiomargarita sp.]|nr:UDP-2,3-diacylglucosamine diphosphatase [Thiomargarita sp.]